jgi:hypothetical protein
VAKRALRALSATRSARSEGHNAGLSARPNAGRTSVIHCSMIPGVQSHTVNTLRLFGAEPFFALPWRT